MNELTFHLLKITISICVALIAFYLVPYIKNKLQSEKYKSLLQAINIAVRAAEQTIKGSGKGAIKKQDVIQFMKTWMVNNNIQISEKQLSEIIEASVWVMNNKE